jgi:anti-sigma regulatory factor (Ser/Thr protein kinase)
MEQIKRNKSLAILNKIEELNNVVAFLEVLEEEWEISPAHTISINLVLEEALTNVIFYAFEKGVESEILIDLTMEGTLMTIIITDEGRPYDPTQKNDPDINLSAEDRPIGGLGIFLIKQIMDEISYERIGSKNQFTMVKKW